MTIDIAATDKTASHRSTSSPGWLSQLLVLGAVWVVLSIRCVGGSTTLTPWVPVFKGIDHAIGTNIPGTGATYPDRMVVHVMRVDLHDPDVKLFPTPRISSNYTPDFRETAGYTVTQFLRTNKLQLAINANFFCNPPNQCPNPTYYLTPGSQMDVFGLFISQGVPISDADAGSPAPALLFDGQNRPRFVMTNLPPVSTVGVSNAVTGLYPLVVAGVNIGRQYLGDSDQVHQVNPRTVYGLSKDKQYLYLMTIDGRQGGYSDGALDWESGAWMLAVGAYEAIDMDGGGSTTLVMQTSTGGSVDVNHSNALADSGKERTVGAHLGIYTKPAPGVINDVVVVADDDAATIKWTTTNPATTQVEYGTTESFGLSTVLQTALTTNHAVILTNLVPNTGYYFHALATIASSHFASSNFFFTTSNYVTTNLVVDLPSTWAYLTANLDGVNWTGRTYNDSAWVDMGPGLLMADIRGLNPAIQPQGTELPVDPGTGYPYITYYFRTHFHLSTVPAGTSMVLTGYIDDGAVVYLNGQEISRLRMDPAPTPIFNNTLAVGYPCDGDATCLDGFDLPANVGTNLVSGDNVLAVEVHNYNPASADITFGLSAVVTERISAPPKLILSSTNGVPIVDWSAGGFLLQQAYAVDGPWTNTPGPVIVGPYSPTNMVPAKVFYRLKK